MAAEATLAILEWSALPYPTWSVEGLIEAVADEADYERFDQRRRDPPAAIPRARTVSAEGLADAFAEILGAPLARRAVTILLVPFPIGVFDRDEPLVEWDLDYGTGQSGAVHRVFADGVDHLVVDLEHWLRCSRRAPQRARGLEALASLVPQARALGLPLLVTFPEPAPQASSDPLLNDLDAALGAWLDEPEEATELEPAPEPQPPDSVLVIHPAHEAHHEALADALLETALDYELSPRRLRASRSVLLGGKLLVVHLRSEQHSSSTELLRSVDAMLDPPLEGAFGATLSGRLIDAAPGVPGCTAWTLTDDGTRLSAHEGFMYTSEETPSVECLQTLRRLLHGRLEPGWARELPRTPFVPLDGSD